MNLQHFIESAARDLGPLLDRSGKVLYSAADTLRPGGLYLLGFNPGGDPAHPDSRTVRESLERLWEKHSNDYLDEAWTNRRGSYAPGQHPLQERVRFLAESIDHDLRSICASNLIFTRSPAFVGAGYPNHAHNCWPVHEAILQMVQPRTILVFGNSAISPFQFLLERVQVEGAEPGIDVETIPSGHGSWTCKVFQGPIAGQKRTVIGFPHLSRYTLRGRPRVVDWVRRLLAA